MKFSTLLWWTVFVCLELNAQGKYDWNWVVGQPKKADSSRAMLQYSEKSVDVISIPLYGKPAIDLGSTTNATTSNFHGIPQFLTNGCKIFSLVSMDTMENGLTINSPGQEFDMNCEFYGYWMFQGIMALPKPESDHEYVLFHLRYDSLFRRQPVSLLHTDIDMNENNGAGRVMQKNVPLMKDSFSDQMAAVRHGNGRDWWLVLTLANSEKIALFLLTANGIKGPFLKETSFNWKPEANNYVRSGKTIFSPNGKLFARTDINNKIQLFQFDRCTGEFSCPKQIDIAPAVDATYKEEWVNSWPKKPFAHSLAFSPNGRFMYANNSPTLFQYDLEATDIQSSWKLVGEVDSFKDPFRTTIHQLLLAPNGKIYGSSTNSMTYLHVMHAPNELGVACDFRNHDLPLDHINGFTLPNYPNFRLYDWAESPCDTLSIDAPADSLKTIWIKLTDNPCDTLVIYPPVDTLCKPSGFQILPNPAFDRIKIAFPSTCSGGSATIFNVAGQLIHEIPFVKHGEVYEVDLQSWAAGVYFVSFYSNESSPVTKKLAVIHD